MKKSINIVAILMLIIINWSCGSSETSETKFKPFKYYSDFQLDLPEYMTEVDLQNADAQMQYGDMLKEHYALIIMENISDLVDLGFDFNIDDYMGFALENVMNTISNSKSERVHKTIQNETGIDYISYKIWGTLEEENIDVYYRLTIFKSDTRFYNLMTWCMADDERTYDPIMDKMIRSFEEL